MTCLYGRRTCAPVDEAHDLHTTAQGWLHRHDHRRCWNIKGGQGHRGSSGQIGFWWHPDDPPDETHQEPPRYRYARDPLQARYPEPWQVVAVSLLLCKTSRPQAEMVTTALFGHVKMPEDLLGRDGVTLDLEGICRPLGLVTNRVRYLQALGRLWDYAGDGCPSAFWVSKLPGCGKYVTDAYRIFALGETPEGVTDPVLGLHLELIAR